MLAPTQQNLTEVTRPAENRGGRFALGVVLFAFVLSFAYSLLIKSLHKEAEFAESNFQANLLRLGKLFHADDPNNTVLLGSSMTARLLPSYFHNIHVINAALDGSSGPTGLRFLNESKCPVKTVLIEENSIARPQDQNDHSLFEAIHEPQMQMAGWLPFLQAAYRPSSVVYSAMKKRVDKERSVSIPIPDSRQTFAPNTPLPSLPTLEMMRHLQEKGVHVMIFRLPAGERTYSGPSQAHQALHGSTFVDIPLEMEAINYVPGYSDGLHLVGPSAKVAAEILASAILRIAPQTSQTQSSK